MPAEQWLAYRQKALGGSDVPALLHLDPYKTHLKLYLEKIGEIPLLDYTNEYMFWGKAHEDTIADRYQFWEGSPESMIENHRLGKRVNRVRRVNAFIHNDRYPWLIGQIDRRIVSHWNRRGPAVLEIKNVRGVRLSEYQDQIPYGFIAQPAAYLLATGLDYAELAMHVDGCGLRVYPIDPAVPVIREMMDRIVEEGTRFWAQVEKARELKRKFGIESYYAVNPDKASKAELEAIGTLQAMEPEAVPGKQLSEMLSQMLREDPAELPLTEKLHRLAWRYVELRDQAKDAQEELDAVGSLIRYEMRGGGVAKFPDIKVSFQQNRRGVAALRVKAA